MRPEPTSHDMFKAQVFATPILDQVTNPDPVTPSYCAQCGTGLMLLEKAARLCQCSPRMLYRWIEQGSLHFYELADGSVLVCGRTLAAQINEREYATSRLPGSEGSQQYYATKQDSLTLVTQ